MKVIILNLLLIGFIFSSSAAQSHPNWQNYTFSKRVTDIEIDDNIIWITTQGGLVKYNKIIGTKTFLNRANSNLPDNNLLCISEYHGEILLGSKYYGVGKFSNKQCINYKMENSGLPSDQYNTRIKYDSKGNLWIASFQWMTRFDGVSWKTWKTGNETSAFPIISDFLMDSLGTVWICSSDGLGKIENEEYSIIPGIPGVVNLCMAFDSINNIWIGADGYGIYRFDGTSFVNYNTDNSCLPTNIIHSISFDSRNRMWLATDKGLINYNDTDSKLFIPPITDHSLLTIEPDDGDTIWCGSLNGRLLCFNGSGFSSIDLSNSPLLDNSIMDINAINKNDIWIATKRNLVYKSDDNYYSAFNYQANAVLKDNFGALWIAFATGDTSLLKIDSKGSTVFDSLNSPFNTRKVSIRRIMADSINNIWIFTGNSGIFKYDGESFINYSTENCDIPSDEIFGLTFDGQDCFWVGTARGLAKFDDGIWTVWDRSNSTIPTNIVNNLAFDSENNLWFTCMDEARIIGGEYGGGLVCFDGQNMISYNMRNSGLKANTIFDIIIDRDDFVWLGTYGAGLMSFDRNDKWISFDVSNSGIASNYIRVLKQDNAGSFWMGHLDAGISVFNPDSNLLSVKNYATDLSVVIYPNPVRDKINIIINSKNMSKVNIRIYDISGKLVFIIPNHRISSGNYQFDIEIDHKLHNNQIYILNLIGDDNKEYNARFLFNK